MSKHQQKSQERREGYMTARVGSALGMEALYGCATDLKANGLQLREWALCFDMSTPAGKVT